MNTDLPGLSASPRGLCASCRSLIFGGIALRLFPLEPGIPLSDLPAQPAMHLWEWQAYTSAQILTMGEKHICRKVYRIGRNDSRTK